MIKGLNSYIIPVIVIILVSLYASFPSFSLALFGDDWQQIWKYFHYIGPHSSVIDVFKHFIGGYGSFEVMTGTAYSLFGNDYKFFYIFAYIYKLTAAFSIWPLTFYLTRSRLASFYALAFLSVTIIGLESTNWVVNSPVYLALAFLNLFFYFFIKSRADLRLKTSILAIVFFYLAHIFAPIRMAGLLPFTFLLELFLNYLSPNIKLTLKRGAIIFTTFVFIVTTSSAAEGTGTLIGGASQTIGSGLSTISTLLNQGRSDFLFYPIITLELLIIPYQFKISTPILFPAVFLFIAVLFINIPRAKKITIMMVFLFILWTITSRIIYALNKDSLPPNIVIMLVLGGYFLIMGLTLMFISGRKSLTIALFLGIFWSVFSYIFPWIRAPETLHPTEQRYLVSSSPGIAILLACIIAMGIKKRNRIFLFLLVLPILVINIFTTRLFFEDVVTNSHGAEAMNKIWSSFPHIPEIGKTRVPLIFYFVSTPNKERLKHHTLTFGFPYRMAMIYNIHDDDIFDSIRRMPMSTNDWSDVVSAARDEGFLVKYEYPKDVVPIEHIHAFYLDDYNNLINVTDQARNKLREELRK